MEKHVRHHSEDRNRLTKGELGELNDDLNSILSAGPHETDVLAFDPDQSALHTLPAIIGVPRQKGKQCTICGECGVGTRPLRGHGNGCKGTLRQVWVQHMVIPSEAQGPHRGKSYIPVSESSDISCHSSGAKDGQELYADVSRSVATVLAAAQLREENTLSDIHTHPFNSRLGWHKWISGYHRSDLRSSIVLPPTFDEAKAARTSPSNLSTVREHVLWLLTSKLKEDSLSGLSYLFHLKKVIGMGDGGPWAFSEYDEGETFNEPLQPSSTKPFKTSLQPTTFAKYSMQITALALHVLRTAPDPEDYKPPSSSDIQAIFPLLLDPPLANGIDPPDRLVFDWAFTPEQLEAAHETRIILIQDVHRRLYPLSAAAEQEKALADLRVDARQAIAHLLNTILLRPHDFDIPDGACALQRFVICRALGKGASYVSATSLSPQLAAIEYGARFCALVKMATELQTVGDNSFAREECVWVYTAHPLLLTPWADLNGMFAAS